MSQHISGNIGQSVAHDLGEFVQIGPKLRLRRDLIIGYDPYKGPGGGAANPTEEVEGLHLWFQGGQQFLTMPLAEAEKEAARLDWLYKGEKR